MIKDEQLKEIREAPTITQDPATEPQKRYITILVEDRQVPQIWLARIKSYVEKGLKKDQASNIIVALRSLPRDPTKDVRDKNKPTLDDIPIGRYAVQTGPHENDISFWRVKESTRRGGHKHRILLAIGGPNEYVQHGPAMQTAIKNIHRFGIGNAASLYGKRIGRCSKCHTRITHRISRELGVGPICGGHYYEDWEERVNRARTTLQDLGLDPDEAIE